MKYGEVQYNEIRRLHKPNMIIGRSRDGDWVDRFDEPKATVSSDEVVLEGYNAIAEYAESALERYEDNVDIQAGLVAIQILHHYRERFGDTTDAMNGALITALLAEPHPNSSKFILAIDAHPAIAAKLQEVMREWVSKYTSVWDIARNPHIRAYLEATSGNDDLDRSLEQIQQLRSE